MKYLLLIFIFAGDSGHSEMKQIEFADKQTCESSAAEIKSAIAEEYMIPPKVVTLCIRNGTVYHTGE